MAELATTKTTEKQGEVKAKENRYTDEKLKKYTLYIFCLGFFPAMIFNLYIFFVLGGVGSPRATPIWWIADLFFSIVSIIGLAFLYWAAGEK